MTRVAGKLGRRPARRPVGLADLAVYLRDPLPAGPAAVPAPQLEAWGMLGNDTYGDCTLAGAVHLRMANAAQHKQVETWPDTAHVVKTYLTLSGGQDTGLVEADVLKAWHAEGLFGDRIVGWAPVDHRNPDELRSVAAAFGGVYLGVAMPAPAQDQFGAGKPWDLTGTSADRSIEGGHAVPLVGYDADHVYVVTWAALQPVTWRWLGAYLEEAYAVLTSEDDRVDHAALSADLAKLT